MKIEHNLEDVVASFAELHSVMKRASAMTLNRTGNAVKAESARHMKGLKYTSAKWTIPMIRKHIAVVSKASVTKPIDQQEVIVRFSSRSLPLTMFDPQNETHNTRHGKRWGVSVKVWGKRFSTGGYHVKGSGSNWRQGSPRGSGSFDETSRVFMNKEGKVKMFKLLNPGGIMQLREGEQKMYEYGAKYAEEIFGNEWDRAIANLFHKKSRIAARSR